jgi:hypothetical protein
LLFTLILEDQDVVLGRRHARRLPYTCVAGVPRPGMMDHWLLSQAGHLTADAAALLAAHGPTSRPPSPEQQ